MKTGETTIIIHDGADTTGIPRTITGGAMTAKLRCDSGANAGNLFDGATWTAGDVQFEVPWDGTMGDYRVASPTLGAGVYAWISGAGTTGAATGGAAYGEFEVRVEANNAADAVAAANAAAINGSTLTALNNAAAIVLNGSAGFGGGGTGGMILGAGQVVTTGTFGSPASTQISNISGWVATLGTSLGAIISGQGTASGKLDSIGAAVGAIGTGPFTITISAAQYAQMGISIVGNSAATIGQGIASLPTTAAPTVAQIAVGVVGNSAGTIGQGIADIKAGVIIVTGGAGTGAVTVTVATTGGTPVADVRVQMAGSAGTPIALGDTLANGTVTLRGAPQAIFLEGALAGWTIGTAGATLGAGTTASATLTAAAFDPGAPADPDTCNVYIWAYSAGAGKASGLAITATLVTDWEKIGGTGGDGIELDIVKTATTNTQGYGLLPLTRELDYRIEIADTRFDQVITVPDLASTNIRALV